MKPFWEKEGVFRPLKNREIFEKTLTVIGNTVAWDLTGDRAEYKCIDIDPFLFSKVLLFRISQT